MENTSSPAYSIPAVPHTTSSSILRRQINAVIKRSLDILTAVMGLVILSPLFVLLAILIKRDSPGPVFFRGPRLGRGGKTFQILKFRTMYEHPESYNGSRVTARGDARITRVGRWLRDTKINELPQLWNVLVGEMSVVGPRPEDPEVAKAWSSEARQALLSVRPGITSPASVIFREEESMLLSTHVMDSYLGTVMPSKLRLDQLYVRRQSLLLDMDTLLWTFLVVILRVGAAAHLEERMFRGPLYQLIRQYVSWFMIDSLVTFAVIGATGVLWRSFGPLDVGWLKALLLGIGFGLLFSLSNAVLGVNRISWSKAQFSDALDLLPALGLSTVAALLINSMGIDRPLLPHGLVINAATMAAVGFVVARYRGRLVEALANRLLAGDKVAHAQERVLIVGGGESGQFAAWYLQHSTERKFFSIAGYIDDDLYKKDTRIGGVNVIGSSMEIPHLVEKLDVGVIIFAIHNIPERDKQRLLSLCHSTPAKIVAFPDIFENLRQILPTKVH